MNHCPPSARRGLTKVELLGCLIALGGGVWIGAQYVGLNLEGAAFQALDESDLLTQIPEEWRPVNPECPDGDCPTAEERKQLEEEQLRAELEQIRARVTRFEWGSDPAGEKPSSPEAISPEDAEARERTLAYWNDLSQVVFEVSSIQQRVAPLADAGSRGQAIALRLQALKYGEKAVCLLDPEGVDAEAVATCVRVAEWFTYSAATLEKALELRSRQPVSGRAATASEVWSQTEGELQQRTELVRRKARETATYLSSRYLEEFVPLGL